MFRRQVDYEVPLLRLLESLPGQRGQSGAIQTLFLQRHKDEIPPEHFAQNKHGSPRWVYCLYWSCYHAVKHGLMDTPVRRTWRLTDEGRRWVVEYPDARYVTFIPEADRPLIAARDEQQADHRSDPDFWSRLEALIDAGLNPAARSLKVVFHHDGNTLRIQPADIRASYYELHLTRTRRYVGLIIRSSATQSQARLDPFRLILGDIGAEVGYPIRAELWNGDRWARLFFDLPSLDNSQQMALAVRHYGEPTAKFINATFATLQQVYSATTTSRHSRATSGRTNHNGPDPLLGQLAHEINTIRAYLAGENRQRPSSEKLCDWVHFCYQFEFFVEGRDLFPHVVAGDVNEWYYIRTKRLARICEIKLESQVVSAESKT